MSDQFLKIKGEELKKGLIPIDIYKSKEDTFLAMANLMCDTIRNNNKENKSTLFICPLGPVGQYKYFVNKVNKEKISLKNLTIINMDEYMIDEKTLIDEKHPLSFRKQMNELCYDLIDKKLLMPITQRIFPNLQNKEEIQSIIKKHGRVDICFGGIGINGHIAFNEPPCKCEKIDLYDFIETSVRVVKIAKETRVVNSLDLYDGAFYLMPKFAITLGMKEILASRKIRLYCFRDWHKSVIRRASFGEHSIDFPASLLQRHSDARIGISEELSN